MAGHPDVRDLIAWQLAHQLNLRVDLFLGSPDFRRQYRFCRQLDVAARSAPLHLAEGVARLRRKELAACVRLATKAEAEVIRHLVEARAQHLITGDELIINKQLAKRAVRAAKRLLRDVELNVPDLYLRNSVRNTLLVVPGGHRSMVRT